MVTNALEKYIVDGRGIAIAQRIRDSFLSP